MTALCDWIPLGNGEWKCSRCDKTRTWIRAELPPGRNCPAGEPQIVPEDGAVLVPPGPPPLVHRAMNFAKAIFSQVALSAEALLGDEEIKLVRSKEEIEAISAICKACPLFNGKVCTHDSCGCPIDADRAVWWNKLAWKSQKCPDGRW